MNKKMTQLAQRREYLVTQAAAQRVVLEQSIESWRRPLALADQGLSALNYVRHHPQWLVGSILLLTVLRPRGLAKWLSRGWVSWQLLNRLRGG